MLLPLADGLNDSAWFLGERGVIIGRCSLHGYRGVAGTGREQCADAFDVRAATAMKVGIVGCGHIAEFHLPHVLRRADVSAVSLADIDPHRAEEIAARFRLTRVYSDFQALLEQERPDIVHVLTPPRTHAELAIHAMESGCHVLVEKPMASTLAEADAMLETSEKNGVQLCVDHNNLWEPLMLRARRLVEEGKAGAVRHVDVHYHFDAERIRRHAATSGSRMAWLASLPGGLVFDLLPHPLSILVHFLGLPDRIAVAGRRHGVLDEGSLDELRVLLEAPGATGSLSISLGIKPDCITTTIHATEMTIHVNLSNLTLVARKNRNIPKKILRPVDNLDQAFQLLTCTLVNGFKVLAGRMPLPDDVGAVIRGFYDSLERGTEPPATGRQGREVVQLMEEIAAQLEPTSVPRAPQGLDMPADFSRYRPASTEPGPRFQEQPPGPTPAEDVAHLPGAAPAGVAAHGSGASPAGIAASRPLVESSTEGARTRALVTGASGFLGRHLVSRLRERHDEVRALVRPTSRIDHLERLGIEIVHGDLKDRASLRRAVEGADVVYHAGAALRGPWEEVEESTVRGTERMLEEALAAGIGRFVHVSSLAVYEVHGLPRNTVVDETCEHARFPERVGNYAHSKIEAEKLAFRFVEKGLPVVVVRPGLIYGPHGKVLFPHLGYPIKGRLFMIVGTGHNLVPLTYVDNAVDALVAAATRDGAVGRAYNVVDDEPITQRDYLERYMTATGSRLLPFPVPLSLLLLGVGAVEQLRRLGVLAESPAPSRYGLATKYKSLRFDTSRAKAELGWQPKVGLEEGLRRTFDWYCHRAEEIASPDPAIEPHPQPGH